MSFKVTGVGSFRSASISMATQGSWPGSGNPARVTVAVPTTAFSSPEW